MHIVYIDRLSWQSLTGVLFSRVRYSQIYFFDRSISNSMISFLLRVKALRTRPLPACFTVAELRDERGEWQYVKIVEDINRLCLEISAGEVAHHPFLKGFEPHFDLKKMVLFFEKTLFNSCHDTVIFVHAVVQLERKQGHPPSNAILFLKRTIGSGYLASYASGLGLSTIAYRSIDMVSGHKYVHWGRTFLAAKLRFLTRRPTKVKVPQPLPKEVETLAPGKATPPVISTWYAGRTITFDLNKRSDLFWLLKSPASRQHVLMYFDRADIPATAQMAETLRKEQVSCMALTPQARTSLAIPVWHSSGNFYRNLFSLLSTVLRELGASLLRLQRVPWFLVSNLFVFIWHFSFWFDFFRTNQIKININPFDYSRSSVCMHLALERNQGISISYQWSNLSFASTLFSSSADVMFSFGPAYKHIWERTGSVIDTVAYCGYITDYAFTEVSDEARKIRERMQKQGVTFTICYFDENSSDDRMSAIPHERSARIYKYLIERMLEDKSLGLILKPGYPRTLFRRLSSIVDLLEKAKRSDRCLFMDAGNYLTEQYPAEAALAADLSIGLLVSGTACLESYLAGTPTIFIDLEQQYGNQLYRTGKNSIVFDDMEELFRAIARYRQEKNSVPGFGDLSTWARDKDPFRDGKASYRMGQYLSWLQKNVNQGGSREDALRSANRKYREQWGVRSIDTRTII